MSDEITSNLEQAASQPQRVRTDAGEVETHDLESIIEADKYLSAKAAAKTKSRGLRFNKLEPPGAT
jgi:hypothetical protein